MPLFGSSSDDAQTWEPQAADGRLAHTAGAEPGGVFTSDLSVSEYATGTSIRRLSEEHRLPATTPKPTFTLGLDS